jgi:hypothetical protein
LGTIQPFAVSVVADVLAGETGSDDIWLTVVFKKLVCSHAPAVSKRFIVHGTPQLDFFPGVPKFESFVVAEIGRGCAVVVSSAKSSNVSKVWNGWESG